MRELDYKVIHASHDDILLNQFILENEFFILKCASNISNYYITKNDDEWSIALSAFMRSVKEYNLAKGSFYSFAELVISRRLIDYFRSKQRHRHEISVDPTLFHSDSKEDVDNLSLRTAIAKQLSTIPTSDARLEINALSDTLSNYGFSFMDLATCSPQSNKTRVACAKATSFLLSQPLIINEIKITKQLPLKIIGKNTKVPRKLLERHRKYIIAAVEILSGEYPILAEYLWFIKEEI